MSYRIKTPHSLQESIRSIVGEQVDGAIRVLREEQDVHKAIHKARKHFKKIRGAWRLIRDELGEEEYKKKNVYYRDLARELSLLRDASALADTVEGLFESHSEALSESWTRSIHAFFLHRRDALAREKEVRKNIGDVVHDLEKHADAVNAFTLPDEVHLARNLTRVYKRGYKALARNRNDPEPAEMHEWRKRCKYLRYHYRLLQKAWSGMLKPLRSELSTLTDILGHYQDLTVLLRTLPETNLPDKDSAKVLSALARKRQEQLHRLALPLGSRLFLARPKQFKAGWEELLDIWQMEKATSRQRS